MLYVGLDVSVRRTSVCVMDVRGHVADEKSVPSTPEAIAAVINAAGAKVERVGLEAGLIQLGSLAAFRQPSFRSSLSMRRSRRVSATRRVRTMRALLPISSGSISFAQYG